MIWFEDGTKLKIPSEIISPFKDKLEIGRIILLTIRTKSGMNGSPKIWKALILYFHQAQNRTIL